MNIGKKYVSCISAAVLGAVLLTSCGLFDKNGIPANSILSHPSRGDAVMLKEEMDEGKIPAQCSVLYDAGGSRPSVTVTDPEDITELYERLLQMEVGRKTDDSMTDSYHFIGFELQDGSWVSWSFEGAEILCTEGKEEICTDNFNYHVEDKGNLWSMVYYLQEEYMKDEESQ